MSRAPLITFKAGTCDFDPDSHPQKVKPKPTPGYVYLYREDDLVHFCWRDRSASVSNPELDLIMFPGDAQFIPYEPAKNPDANTPRKSTNGRVFVLKFSSSSQRHFFWLQSKHQSSSGDPSHFSPRDRRLGNIVSLLISGDEVDMNQAIATLNNGDDDDDDDDENGGRGDDNMMEDIDHHGGGSSHHRGGSGGAGPDATGGDIREEGEESREGGADGGRAASAQTNDPSALVQNFLSSLKGGPIGGNSSSGEHENLFPSLPDLLSSGSTVPVIETANADFVDQLLRNLPSTLLLLAQESSDVRSLENDPSTVEASLEALSLDQKKTILRRVLLSPQFTQSLGSLTMALRDGGLPSISEALGISVENGGFMRRGGMPLGGGEALAAFLNGVKKQVEDKDKGGLSRNDMQTD